MKRHFFPLFPLMAIILICQSGCGLINSTREYFSKKPDMSVVNRAVKTSLMAGYAASVAMSAAQGHVPANVSTAVSFASFPTAGIMTIALSAGHVAPPSVDQGAILVSGLWDSPTQAVLTAFFAGTNVQEGTFTLSNIGLFPASVDTAGAADTLQVVLVEQDVNSATDTIVSVSFTSGTLAQKTRWFSSPMTSFDTALAIEQNALITFVTMGNPSDPSGNAYVTWAGGQRAAVNQGDVKVTQFAILNARVAPATCTLNPLRGYTIIKDLGASHNGTIPELGTAFIEYNSSCSGKAHVIAGTGTYIGASGANMALDFN